jgi:hypothetical protein
MTPVVGSRASPAVDVNTPPCVPVTTRVVVPLLQKVPPVSVAEPVLLIATVVVAVPAQVPCPKEYVTVKVPMVEAARLMIPVAELIERPVAAEKLPPGAPMTVTVPVPPAVQKLPPIMEVVVGVGALLMVTEVVADLQPDVFFTMTA